MDVFKNQNWPAPREGVKTAAGSQNRTKGRGIFTGLHPPEVTGSSEGTQLFGSATGPLTLEGAR
jgi:hypothetical protein